MADKLVVPISIKKMSDSTLATYTGIEGELVFNRTSNSVFVMDGKTKNGHRVGFTKTSELTNDARFVGTDEQGNLTIPNKITSNSIEVSTSITSNSIEVTSNLDCGSEITCNTINVTSDLNQKENLEKINPENFDLSKLNAYRFNFKGNSDKHIGLIAQDAEKIMPNITKSRQDGTKMIDYNGIVALLVSKVAMLQDRIEKLEQGKK